MTKLSYLHEPGVLHNLATRYELNKIYVRYHSYSVQFHLCSMLLLVRESNKACCYGCLCIILYPALILWQTYTGSILIAINPFQRLPDLYDDYMMEQYKGAPLGKLNPHVFAIADVAFR